MVVGLFSIILVAKKNVREEVLSTQSLALFAIESSIKNNELSGKVVTLTEFGFQKIQDIENNDEMKEFITRICIERNIDFDDETIQKISWLFSGDSNEYHESISQTWNKFNKILNLLNIKELNKNSLRP